MKLWTADEKLATRIAQVATLANVFGFTPEKHRMRSIAAKDAKYGFGKLIDLARAEPVAVAKHGRPVVVVMAIEEYERLKALEQSCPQSPTPTRSSART